MKPLIIYHGNCLDGFTAAWAAWKKFGDKADYWPGFYNKPAPAHDMVRDRDVVLLDFSYKRHVLVDIAEFARSVLVLDHHKSAMEDLTALCKPRDTWEQHIEDAGNYDPHMAYMVARFDMARSGAALAWLYFHPDRPLPSLVRYVEDRDLWKFSLPNSHAVNLALFSRPYEFPEFEAMYHACQTPDVLEVLASEGKAIQRKHSKDVDEIVRSNQRRMNIAGFDVPVVNCNHTYGSDAANILAKGNAFAAYYYDTPSGRTFGLRSIKGEGIDVSVIASKFGGGGHANASGFELSLSTAQERGLL